MRLLSFFDINIIFIQKPRQAVQRELCFFYLVGFRVDREIEGSAEVGLFKYGVRKYRSCKIAFVKNGSREIAARKISFTAAGICGFPDRVDSDRPVWYVCQGTNES